ncbi:F0F1 ATP synthase subunit delta [Lacibacterium aquatile]|uniref:ATP synthase subunit delta n=1 Tax=Lacibacterium aquatile TaxID=1168082 RepID=A0ABW5DX34_9PROT
MATQKTGLAERYAVALYDLADGAKALDAVAGDLKALGQAIVEVPDLARVLNSPVLSRADQSKAIAAVLEKSGAHELTRRFIGVIAQNRRLAALTEISKAFLALLAQKRGEVLAEVVAAQPLTDAQVEKVKDALKGTYGSKVVVDVKVDAGLIGGLIVKVGSKLIDHSLKTKLMRLQLAMKGVG